MKKLLVSSMLMAGLCGFSATLPVSNVALAGAAGTVVAGGAYLGAGMPGFNTILNGAQTHFAGSPDTICGALGNAAATVLDMGYGAGQAGVTIGKPFYYAGTGLYSIAKDIGILGCKIGKTIPAFIETGSIGVHACGDFVKKHPTALATVVGGVIGYHYIYKPALEWWEKESWWSKPKEKKKEQKFTIAW